MTPQVTITTEEDKADASIPAFDFTKLTALNTCPRWGLVRYDQHKRMPGEGRSTALEMGSAAHDGFAAVRLFELLEFGNDIYTGAESTIEQAGLRLFGEVRYSQMLDIFKSSDDIRRRVNAFAIHACNTSGFYDDPKDKRRTLSNLEQSMVAYIDRLELGRRLPLVRGDFVGIEVPFDITLRYADDTGDSTLRYIGRIDGLVLDRQTNRIEVEENKTASRLNDAWQNSFITSHQVTGYCVAATTLLQDVVVDNAMIRGMMIPLPKTYDLGGIANVPVDRDHYRFLEWYKWVWHTYSTLYLPYKDNPLYAPEYTHSCNRYFMSCSLIPLCAMAEPGERELTFSQMETDEWSPLHERGTGEA